MNLQSSTLVTVMALSPYCFASKFCFCSNQLFICTEKHQIFPRISEKSLPMLTSNILSYLELRVHSLKDNKWYFSSVLWNPNSEAVWCNKQAPWAVFCSTAYTPPPSVLKNQTDKFAGHSKSWESCWALVIILLSVLDIRSPETRIYFPFFQDSFHQVWR